MTEEIRKLAEKLVSLYDWDNNSQIRVIYDNIKPNELKFAEAYLDNKIDIVKKQMNLWYQYIDINNNIHEKEGSVTILSDFFKQCFTMKQAILFDGMTVVAIYQIDDLTGYFYLKTYNTDSRFSEIINKLKKAFDRVSSNLNLDNL